MKCMILAAGYATRLYPLTENFPKPLLEVREKTILDWLIEDLERGGRIEQYIIVSNHKFAGIFERWIQAHPLRDKLTLIDDGTSDNENRLGAVRDIQLGISSCSVSGDLLVMAGDNLLSFSLNAFLDHALAKGTSCVMRYYEPDLVKLRKTGVAEVDSDGLILSMEEKPAEPKAHWCCPPFYFIRRDDVPKVAGAIEAGCAVDAPGSFIAWLSTQTPVHAFEMPGRRYDIGNLESYRKVQQEYEPQN